MQIIRGGRLGSCAAVDGGGGRAGWAEEHNDEKTSGKETNDILKRSQLG